MSILLRKGKKENEEKNIIYIYNNDYGIYS